MMHVIKYSIAEINCIMQRFMSVASNSIHYRDYLWGCFLMMPLSIAIVYKEQIARESLINLTSILTF